MSANTRQVEKWIKRLTLLFTSATILVHERKRTEGQVERLLSSLQSFKDAGLGGAAGYVVLRVARVHGGDFGGLTLVVGVEKISSSTRHLLEPEGKVDFQNPSGGWSHGYVVGVLDESQSRVLATHLAQSPTY